jgi:hypothetical protein
VVAENNAVESLTELTNLANQPRSRSGCRQDAPDTQRLAHRRGWLCDQVAKAGCFAVADFICPTPAARAAFSAGGEYLCTEMFVISVDRTLRGHHRMFVPPERFVMVAVPNITNNFCGRDVGYGIERIDLDSALEESRPPRPARSLRRPGAEVGLPD